MKWFDLYESAKKYCYTKLIIKPQATQNPDRGELEKALEFNNKGDISSAINIMTGCSTKYTSLELNIFSHMIEQYGPERFYLSFSHVKKA